MHDDDDGRRMAVCRVEQHSGSSAEPVMGVVTFHKLMNGHVAIDVELSGFDTDNEHTLHGFHIHQTGDTGDGCRLANGHYNPHSRDHGAPSDVNR